MKQVTLLWYAIILSVACSTASQRTLPPGDSTVVAYAPVAVAKAANKKIFVHLMPWFETKTTNEPAGKWGIHWTMNNQDPDKVDANGRRQIASHYYPLIGPYASGDPDVIEYQLLLMKLSGIDGVLIDWPGTINLYDYPRNAANSEKIIAQLAKIGLQYAMVYEDQNVNIAYNKGAISDKVGAAQKDMQYLEKNHFGKSNYEKIDDKPLLLDFGPQTFTTEGEWTNIFSQLTTPPSFFTLWDHSGKAGHTATGEFAWINSDNTTSLINFYSNSHNGEKIGAAYPGFKTYYAQGGWAGPIFTIDANSTATFQTTLSLALQSNAGYIQLPTWNDYGEGTMIEPTVEFQYTLLTALQKATGVKLNQSDLELVSGLYNARVRYSGNVSIQKRLDQVFYYIVSLQMSKASDLLKTI